MSLVFDKKIRAIITGATGMVGEGVLHECLLSPQVEAVLIINRNPSGVVHPKLKEIILKDFFKTDTIKLELSGYNACFFCLGISSVGVTKHNYYSITYQLTLGFAKLLSTLNPGLTFCYVSGAGTDSTEKGRLNWARVKGKTENDLMKLPFKQFYAFRPGFMKPTPGLTRTQPAYQYIGWLYPIGKVLFPNTVSTLAQVGQAMIRAVTQGYEKNILEVKDIVTLANRPQ
jgi:uncharacterized protein YbjT (DUF2867 family)